MNYDWHDRIEVDPRILHGKPCIRGTRTPAALILGYVAAGQSTEDILREFPDINGRGRLRLFEVRAGLG